MLLLLQAFATLLVLLLPRHGGAQAPAVALRISIENPCDHVQAAHVADFARRLAERAGDGLRVEYHCAAELYRDSDTPRMLALGRLEMAVPGIWQLTAVEPGFNIFMLPAFYGRQAADVLAAADGLLGATLAARLQATGSFIVPGRSYALGHMLLFGVGRDIDGYAEVTGATVRVAGGDANERRIAALGGKPIVVPWPDLPEALRRGRVDALLTSYETVESGGLMRHGVSSAFEDRQYFGLYVPLVSAGFWSRLTPELRELVRRTWEETVDTQRAAAARAQEEARARLIGEGLTVNAPTAKELAAMRERLMQAEPAIATACGVDAALLGIARGAPPSGAGPPPP